MGTGVSSCFWGVYASTYPDDEMNYYSEEKFCERFAPHYREHEYINGLTALFITGMGFYQLSWDHPYGIIRFLAGCFFVNGVASFLNHWYGTRDWYILDNASMYIPAWTLCAAITEDLYAIALDYDNTLRNNRVWRPLIKGTIWGITCVAIFFLLYNDMNGCDWGTVGHLIFPLGFAFPPVLMGIEAMIFVGYAFDIINARYLQSTVYYGHRFEKSVVYLTWGVNLAIFGAVLWVGFEMGICANVDAETRAIVAYIPIHSVWHIVESYALSLIMVFFVSLTALRDQIRADARFDTIMSTPNRSPDFALKTGKSRFIGTRCCCYCCPPLQSRTFNELLNIVFPIPTKLYDSNVVWNQTVMDVLGRRPTERDDDKCCDKYFLQCFRDIDATYVTKKKGCCRCWIDKCICCCEDHHYPVPSFYHQDDGTELIVVTENEEKRGLMDDNLSTDIDS